MQRVDQQGAEARIRKHPLNDDNAADQEAEVQCRDIERRDDGVRQGVAPEHRAGPQAFQFSETHIVRTQHLDQAVTQDADGIARRITVEASRISSETFPFAVPPEEAERRCRRALMEAWTGRESAVFRLPPSRLALDPSDVTRLDHDGRQLGFRLVSVADAESRSIEAIRQDRQDYDLPPGAARPAAPARIVAFGAPDVVILDLPQLTESHIPHHPLIAVHAVPWPGQMVVFRSPGSDGFELVTAFATRAHIGSLVNDLWSGPVSRFDHGNVMIIDLVSGTLESVTDMALFGGANVLAVESAPGTWEVLQAGSAELIAPGRYRLTRLLRGQRGTELAIGNPVPAGARVVVLDSLLADLPVAEADLGIPWNWRIGPASKPVSDETYVARSFAPEGIGLRPFAPVHVEQPWRKARVPGDFAIHWTRRDRSLAADSWNAAEVSMSEATETYEVDILDGSVVKRSLTTTTTSAVYTEAEQIADWGTPLGPGNSLTVRITQLGQLFGAGAANLTTLWF